MLLAEGEAVNRANAEVEMRVAVGYSVVPSQASRQIRDAPKLTQGRGRKGRLHPAPSNGPVRAYRWCGSLRERPPDRLRRS